MKIEKYCSSLNCDCKMTPNAEIELSMNKKSPCCGRICLCSFTQGFRHNHGSCLHPMVFHIDHFDYLVNGELHHFDDGQCYYHGRLEIVQDDIFSQTIYDF